MSARCRCLGASHGPNCSALDAFDELAEERECQRIEAEMRAERERAAKFRHVAEAAAIEAEMWEFLARGDQ